MELKRKFNQSNTTFRSSVFSDYGEQIIQKNNRLDQDMIKRNVFQNSYYLGTEDKSERGTIGTPHLGQAKTHYASPKRIVALDPYKTQFNEEDVRPVKSAFMYISEPSLRSH